MISGDRIQLEKWEKHCKELGELDEIAWDVVETYTSLKMSDEEKAQCRTENGGIKVCKAWDDRFLDGKEAGIREGKEAGIREGKEAGIREGKEAGMKAGREETEHNLAIKFVKLGLVSLEAAAKELGVGVEQFRRYMEESDEIVEVA